MAFDGMRNDNTTHVYIVCKPGVMNGQSRGIMTKVHSLVPRLSLFLFLSH